MIVVKDDCLLEAFLFLTRDTLDDPLPMVSRQFTRVLSRKSLQSAPHRLMNEYAQREGEEVAWLKFDDETLTRFPRLLHPPHFEYGGKPYACITRKKLDDLHQRYPWLRALRGRVIVDGANGDDDGICQGAKRLWDGGELAIELSGPRADTALEAMKLPSIIDGCTSLRITCDTYSSPSPGTRGFIQICGLSPHEIASFLLTRAGVASRRGTRRLLIDMKCSGDRESRSSGHREMREIIETVKEVCSVIDGQWCITRPKSRLFSTSSPHPSHRHSHAISFSGMDGTGPHLLDKNRREVSFVTRTRPFKRYADCART